MSNECPDSIDDAKVICFAKIDPHHKHTGNTRQIVGGRLLGAACGLAICQYPDDQGFYLFGCDDTWCSITDTWHQSLKDAQSQAEFEYEGVSSSWVHKP